MEEWRNGGIPPNLHSSTRLCGGFLLHLCSLGVVGFAFTEDDF